MKKLLLALLLMLCTSMLFGQGSLKELAAMPKDAEGRYPFWRCATVEVNNALRSQNPNIPSVDEFEKFLEKATIHRKQFKMSLLEEQVYFIPVVVHVIHNGEAVGQGSNISYAQIQSQIEVLNEDFRKKEGSRGFNDHPAGADAQLEFILAEIGPEGEPLSEPGVHRVHSSTLGVSGTLDPGSMDGIVKPATYWDPNRYLNMWTANLGGGLLGYAQFPVNSGLDGMDIPGMATAAETEGVVMRYTTFGSSDKGDFNLYAPYDKGRTTTHEVGHWLGLRHIWGDGGCGVDDFCNDTPASDGPNTNCDFVHFSCGSEDMTQNYMDYSTDLCMSIFTAEQKERFLTVLEYSPRRKELLNSNVLARANFMASGTSIYEGQRVHFSDLSVGGINEWSWVFEGGEPASSNEQSPTVTYGAPGSFAVSLTAGNGTSSYEEHKAHYIIVEEPATVPSVDFTIDFTDLFTGMEVQFQDASDASVFSWNWEFEGGEPGTSTEQNPKVHFPEPGTYGVKLTVHNSKGAAEKTVNDMLNVVLGPQLIATPAELEKNLLVGESVPATLTLSNPGDQSLSYFINSTFDSSIFTVNQGEESGDIAPNANKEVEINFSTGSFNGGLYSGIISINTNDPRNRSKDISVTLEIRGIPSVELAETTIDFGGVLNRDVQYDTLFLINTGTDTLRVSAEIDGEAFSMQESQFTIPADSTLGLRLAFNPLSLGAHSGSLTLQTNDPENELLIIALSGESLPAPEVVVSPERLDLALAAGDSTNEIISIRNAGGMELNFSIELEKKIFSGLQKRKGLIMPSYAERDSTKVIYSLNSNVEEANVLVVQNTLAWSVDVQRDVLSPMGIPSHKINSASISTTDFSPYDLIITVSEEDYSYYNAVSNSKAKFEEFARAGGGILYQTVSFGQYVDLAGGVVAEPNDWELYNEIVDPNHPIVLDLPSSLYDNAISQNFLESLPENADIISIGKKEPGPTTVEYSVGRGKIIATGMNWEWGLTNGSPYGNILPRAIEYLLNNTSAVSWLSEDISSGAISGGEETEVSLKVNAKYLNGGTYQADVHILSNDPANELTTVPVTLVVSGVPEISTSATALDYGSLWVGHTKSLMLSIENPGTDTLRVNPVLDSESFLGDTTSIKIPAKKSFQMEVSFVPLEEGDHSAQLILHTNDPEQQEVTIALRGSAVSPPQLQYNPEAFSLHLNSGETKTEELLLENTGGDTLFYSLKAQTINERRLVRETDSLYIPAGLPAKGEVDQRKGKAVTSRSGNDGEEGFGYTWIDSREVNGPQYNWIEISGNGTSLYLGDDNAFQVNLPFPFSFYGEEKNSVYISSNGFITFQSAGASSTSGPPMPDYYQPNDLIAAFWADLYPSDKVKYYSSQEYFIVQYTDVPRYGGGGSLTFQFILYPNGNIKLQYKRMVDPYSGAIIGIENSTGDEAMELAFNTPFVEDELAVLIQSEKMIDFEPALGSILPGASASVQLSFNAEGLMGGLYNKEIVLNTNDPLKEVSLIPVTLEVTGVPELVLSSDILLFDSALFVGDTAHQILYIHNAGTMSLEVDSISVSSENFTLSAAEAVIEPGNRLELMVSFTSTNAGSFTDTLLIKSNDVQNESVALSLVAFAYGPPVMTVTEPFISTSMKIGEAAKTFPVTIKNTGGYPLSTSFSVVSIGGKFQNGKQAIRKVGFYADTLSSSLAAQADLSSSFTPLAETENEIIEETYPNFIYSSTGMVWVEGKLYVLQWDSGFIYIYDPERQEATHIFTIPVNSFGLTWDGEYLWTTRQGMAWAYTLGGKRMGNFELPANHNGDTRSISWDGSAFMVCTPFYGEQVYRMNEMGEILTTYALPAEVRINQLYARGGNLLISNSNTYQINALSVVGEKLELKETLNSPFSQVYGLALDSQQALWVADWQTLYKLNTPHFFLPHWVKTDPAGTPGLIAPGEEKTINIIFEASEGMEIGKYTANLEINSNDPEAQMESIRLELEVLNTDPEVTGQPGELEMVLGDQDLQLDLRSLFKDVNSEDQLKFFGIAADDKLELAIANGILNIHALKGGVSSFRLFSTDLHGGKSEDIMVSITVIDKNNHLPKIALGSSMVNLVQVGQTRSIALKDIFTDPDGDALLYATSINNNGLLRAEIKEDSLLLTGLKNGSAKVRVKAMDGRGGEADFTFTLKVNASPRLHIEMSRQLLAIDSDTLRLRLNELFTDADGDLMVFNALADLKGFVNIDLENNVLTLVPLKKGEVIVSIAARDQNEGVGQTSFTVVIHNAPQIKEPMKSRQVRLSDTHSFNLYPYFEELDGEAMSFGVSFDEEALQVSVEGSVIRLEGLKLGLSTVVIEVRDARGAKITSLLEVNVVKVLAAGHKDLRALRVYPNPFTHSLTIENEFPGAVTAGLYDQLGRLLHQENWMAGGQNSYKLALADLPSGTYHLKIMTTKGQRVVKVVKE